MTKAINLGLIVEMATKAVIQAGLDPMEYEDDLLEELAQKRWRFSRVGERLFATATPNGVLIGQFDPDEIFWAECGYDAARKRAKMLTHRKEQSDRAALNDPKLRDLAKKGWLVFGVEEGLFETETPNGIQIGPMTANELLAADCGYQAGLRVYA